ncbi:cytochrome P450 6B5-like [Nymphalis io]|uniref:cytochrome P450 6B5-like n=1 Tax=Inachis io TaxID=171585 RepID=UPI0021698172|nr:cytochrome P450 6B5-like [Nymphalis io]
MLTLILLLLSAVLLFKIYFIRYQNYWRKQNVIQIDGVVNRFMFGKRSLGEIYKEIMDENPSQPYIGIFLGSSPTLLLRDLKDIESVLQSNFNCFNNRGIVTNPQEPLTDNMLFTNNYNRWKLMKQTFSPMLTNTKIKIMFQYIHKSARDFLDPINNDKECSLRDMYAFGTSIIAASIFAIDQTTSIVNTLTDMFWDINEASKKNNIIFYISNTFPEIFKLLNFKHFDKYNELFVNFVKQIIENRRKDNDVSRQDIVQSVLQLQKNGIIKDETTGYEIIPTDELVAAQYFLFFLGGIDNISISLHFAMLELAHNKYILDRLHNEIDIVFENCNDKINFEELGKLEYLDMIISELLRKYPPVLALQRCCTSDTTLPSTQAKVYKGTTILVPVFALHRDPKLFPDPELFDPDIFSSRNQCKITKFSYLPFGEGQRKCLGVRFERILLKFSIAVILRKCTVKENKYEPNAYDHSFFSLRDSSAHFILIPRNKVNYS